MRSGRGSAASILNDQSIVHLQIFETLAKLWMKGVVARIFLRCGCMESTAIY